jgi:hypothetical protein
MPNHTTVSVTRSNEQVWLEVKETGFSQNTRCPVHDDRRASLSIFKADGKVDLKCHVGCVKEDILREWGWLTIHQYIDAAGNVLHETYRVDYPDGKWVRQRDLLATVMRGT